MIAFTVVTVDLVNTSVVFERPKVAMSVEALGTVIGVQFVAVFQSPEAGLWFHVALPARVRLGSSKSWAQVIPTKISLFIGAFLRIACAMREITSRGKPSARPMKKLGSAQNTAFRPYC